MTHKKNEYSDIEIILIQESGDITKDVEEAMLKLLPQLDKTFSGKTDLAEVLKTGALLLAREKGEIVGSLTLVIYQTAFTKQARIEDVVVDESHRQKGIGEELNTEAIELAKKLGVAWVDLTSNPTRVEANALYQKLGFIQRDTNIYRKELNQPNTH